MWDYKTIVYHDRYDLTGILRLINDKFLVEQEDGNFMVYTSEWIVVGGMDGI